MQSMNKQGQKIASGLLIAGVVMGMSGCVQRKLKITSQPDGALVYLNDQEVGRTPIDVNFTFYGKYDVRLEKQGYQPLWTTAEAKAPFWENPPMDLIAELLPGDKLVEVDWNFELEKTSDVHNDPQNLLDRAELMRTATREEKSLLPSEVFSEGVEANEPAGPEVPSE